MTLLFAIALLLQTPASCLDVADCRASAEPARARADFETFHDLAWRAVQKGRPNDPDLMYLLARAQSLSGRPDDALVMLGRLADLGIPTDAATNPDFVPVRLLPRWPELAGKLGVLLPAGPSTAGAKPSGSAAAPRVTAPVVLDRSTAPGASTSSASAPSVFLFDAPSLSAVALGHDAVSRRFVLGDRLPARLLIVDEVSRHVVSYASAATAGFFDELTGFALDARRGDLWVVSAKGTGRSAASVLHKLQLVSGRTLLEAPLPDGTGAARLAAVAVTPDGTVYTVDALGSRLFRLRPGSRRLELVMRLDVETPRALTAADDRVLYVAGGTVTRVDLAAHAAARLASPEDLTDFDSLAWRNGALVGVERVAGAFLIVRIPLDPSGTRAQPRAILAASPQPAVGALGPDGFYYLADRGAIRYVKVR